MGPFQFLELVAGVLIRFLILFLVGLPLDGFSLQGLLLTRWDFQIVLEVIAEI